MPITGFAANEIVDGPTVDGVETLPGSARPRKAGLPRDGLPTVKRRPRRAGRSARVFDVCLALVLMLGGLPSVFHSQWRARLLLLVLDLALTVPLIWRRRWPTQVFAVVALAAFVQWLTNQKIGADVALLVAFYSVAVREGRQRTIAAAAFLELGILLAVVRWVQGGAGNKALVFVLFSGMATAAGVIGANIRTRRAYLASIEDRNVRLELERDQQAQISAAAERARIAREMHDIVAHNLSVMIALADGAALIADDDPARAKVAMGQVSGTGRQALTEMRRLLGVLRADAPAALEPQPGLTDLDALLTQVRLVGLRGELVTEGRLPPLPAGLQLTIYRLVQEALTNTLKHAVEPETATVRLRFSEGAGLEVEVTDDGTTAASVADAGNGGHGINGMRERAAVYGGTVEAGPRPGRGWQVRGTFDLRASGIAS